MSIATAALAAVAIGGKYWPIGDTIRTVTVVFFDLGFSSISIVLGVSLLLFSKQVF